MSYRQLVRPYVATGLQFFLPCAASALLGGLILTIVAVWSSNRVVAQWIQTSGSNYGSFDPYALAVVDRGTDYSSIPWDRHYELFIGRSGDVPGYGHRVAFSFHPGRDTTDEHIHRSAVVWTTDGVTFSEPSGDQVFIPKAAFIGGR